ncbi:hypothetical protein [Shinella zoogloeoides]|uniref:hypothetical protein n=1 Tax=Shinella zoogloeoides TaxID=352475 RepID=UPI00299D709C|nr:hypothetical protein [Shinella zoogloeoides]WPE19912.1 hypothetical protein ShzoTeo12_10880 [Shinella zoogloeoides]
MPTHEPSNFATYSDALGNPVFDTFFVLANLEGEDQLFAFRSPRDRDVAELSITAKGMRCQALTHQEAFILAREGMLAWVHNGDVPADMVWSPIYLKYPARVA